MFFFIIIITKSPMSIVPPFNFIYYFIYPFKVITHFFIDKVIIKNIIKKFLKEKNIIN